jgi:hypothetical protein
VDSLETINWRIERADEHLAALDRERDIFLNQEDRLIVGDLDRNTGEYVFRFKGSFPIPVSG